jgi:peptidoglycan/LPS O-acetylase OafA/YrhL
VPFALSVHLDLVRFLAAMLVFVGHVSGQRLSGGLFWQAQHLPNLAVVIFFVLSGWVISHVTTNREKDWRTYTTSRAARIYSVAIPAILIGVVLDAIGSHLRPDLYNPSWGYIAEDTTARAIISLLFMNQIWMVNIVPGSNQPYWSLGFEVSYYIIFGLALFAPRRWRALAVVTALAIAGPRIVLLMTFWLLGVAGERASRTLRLSPMAGLLLAAGALAIAIGADIFHHRVHPLSVLALSVIWQPNFPHELIIASAFALHFVGIHAAAPLLDGLARRVATPVRWFAGATFTLYLFHLPLAQFFCSLAPWPAGHSGTRTLVFGGTFLASLAIAQFTERRKDIWRRLFTTLLGTCVPARS